ncbi:MAG TPA: hypothetical protein VMM16_12260 [Verrucomicrobiae bacterium]|nr:hypothetical protein [Verrucomicrobiae bacterium]
MSMRERLNSYIAQLERRMRVGAALRGAAVLASVALGATALLVLVANAFAFSRGILVGARVVLLFSVVLAVTIGLAIPLRRINRRRAAATAESAFPRFQQRLVTFAERDSAAHEPFLELLAADTLEVARDSAPEQLVPSSTFLAWFTTGVVSLGVLIWMIVAGPGFLGYGAALLWAGPREGVVPFYDIHVSPGDATVRRNADELVTAQPVGIETNQVRLYARSQSSSKWEQLAMQPQPGGSAFQFVFAGLPESVEYYVEAGAVRSRHFNLRVIDLPSVKQIRVTYRFPPWTGMRSAIDEHGGDLRAVEGTEANLEVLTDRPLRDGVLVLDDGQQVHLSGGDTNRYTGSIQMAKDGAYHVAAMDQGQPVRLSEDFFIEADKANPPEIAIDRPGRDYRASPIEEVTISVKANDAFGISGLALHYSVNGSAEQTVDLLKQKGAKEAEGATVISLEDYKLVPGDIVSFYASAKDARAESHTDMFFIQAEPFEREFSQSQQSAGGAGGGGGQGDQNDISQREKEIIAETWKHQNDKSGSQQQAAEAGKFLSQVQAKLRDQAIALAGRMGMRELNGQNEEFNAFQKDMNAAADAMNPAADKLRQQKWSDALPNEQKALQHLLQAEATFRQIQVAFGNGAAGSGAGGAGRDLASLFDLELDTQKNQYETAQTASSADQRAKEIDDALKKLDELARRQQDLAQQRNNGQSFEQRWQQEMLRRDAEELQRQMEQLAQSQEQSSASSSSGQSSSGQSSSGQSQSSQSQKDSRVRQALDRLRQANDDMRRAASSSQSQDSADARRAADRLRDATNLLSEMQRQNSSGRLDSMAREADRIAGEQRAQADRLHRLLLQRNSADSSGQSQQNVWQDVQSLARDRQQLADDLARLEQQMRGAARELAPTQRDAASKLRGALGDSDQSDLQTRLQRSADWLRRGYDPNSNSTEPMISADLQHLADGLRQAQRALGPDQGPGKAASKDQGRDAEDALDHVQRLRDQMEALTRDLGGRNPQGGQAGRQPGQQEGRGGQPGQNGTQAGNYGGAVDDGYRQGYDPGRARGGNRNWYIDTGNNSNLPQPAAPENSPVPADPERAYQQALNSLDQLHQSVEDDPEIAREVQDLIRQMQKLDPKRFPGNPVLLEQLHTQVLNQVDDLELQLQRKLDGKQSGQVRSADSKTIPAGYQDAVADYFRRLSKNP